MEKNFIRVRSAKDIVITSALIVSGTVLVVLPSSDSLNILGFFVLITGILLLALLKTGYKDEETGIRYCKTEHYFEGNKRESLAYAITHKPRKSDISGEDKGNALRMDIYHSRKEGKAYIQLFEYVPYKYEPYTKVHEHDFASVIELIEK